MKESCRLVYTVDGCKTVIDSCCTKPLDAYEILEVGGLEKERNLEWGGIDFSKARLRRIFGLCKMV